MIGQVIRWVLWILRSVRRRLKRTPQYVVLRLEDDYEELPPKGSALARKLLPTKTTMRDLRERFEAIAADPRVHGVVLHVRPLKMPLSRLQSIRSMIERLHASGKHVVAWSTSYNTGAYVVASACDEVLLQTGGDVQPLGSRLAFPFMVDALERLGLQGDFVQISPYKSAADVLTRREMSAEVREMANWLVDSLYEQCVSGIASGRGIDPASARSLVDRSPYIDLAAVESRVVDGLLSEEALPRHLGDGKPARLMTWEDARKRLLPRPPRPLGKYVALLRIEGDIVDGESKRPPMAPPARLPFLGQRAGDLTVVQDARKLAKDKRAAAVVVWVESGGGSANASEAMSAALDAIAERKPLVASMGSVAGSGGYYVTTPARWVVAQPASITGSIGVLSGKIVNAGMWTKLRVHFEDVVRGENITFLDARRPFTDAQRKVLWDGISRTYDVFLDRVCRARVRTRDEIDRVGGGRVWTGQQALEHGLVDELGDLDVAVMKARELAGLRPRARVREVKAGKRQRAPDALKEARPAAYVEYALEGLHMFDGRSLCLCPLVLH